MNIYVRKLSFDTTEQDLRQAFEAFGQVTSANILATRSSGQSKGFGFNRDLGERSGAGSHRRYERQGDQGACTERERGPSPQQRQNGRQRDEQATGQVTVLVPVFIFCPAKGA